MSAVQRGVFSSIQAAGITPQASRSSAPPSRTVAGRVGSEGSLGAQLYRNADGGVGGRQLPRGAESLPAGALAGRKTAINRRP